MMEMEEIEVNLTKKEMEKVSEVTDLQGRFVWEKFLSTNWARLLPFFLGAVLVGLGLLMTKSSGKKEIEGIEIITGDEGEVAGSSENKTIWIDIAGAVINPGVYELPQDARVNDLLIAAGGLSGEADREWVEANLNRAQKLVDGVKVYIPQAGEIQEAVAGGSGAGGQKLGQATATEQKYFGVVEKSTGLVNINTASQGELETLPGIGPAYAQRIIEYRESHSGFKAIEEIKNVSGIGEKTFEKIKEKITI